MVALPVPVGGALAQGQSRSEALPGIYALQPFENQELFFCRFSF
jgi:hypothetical protein